MIASAAMMRIMMRIHFVVSDQLLSWCSGLGFGPGPGLGLGLLEIPSMGVCRVS